jgi:hypothetical protein
MKSCPSCDRTYADESNTFCLVDGAILSAPYDPEATLIISEASTDDAVQKSSPSELKLKRQIREEFRAIKLALMFLVILGIPLSLIIGAIKAYLEGLLSWYTSIVIGGIGAGLLGMLVVGALWSFMKWLRED